MSVRADPGMGYSCRFLQRALSLGVDARIRRVKPEAASKALKQVENSYKNLTWMSNQGCSYLLQRAIIINSSGERLRSEWDTALCLKMHAYGEQNKKKKATEVQTLVSYLQHRMVYEWKPMSYLRNLLAYFKGKTEKQQAMSIQQQEQTLLNKPS